MNKRGLVVFWLSIVLAILLIGTIFVYFALFKPSSVAYSGRVIQNPIEGLNDSEAVLAFDESFVYYLLYGIKAYNLHNVPLSSNYPKMEIEVSGEIFSASVRRGTITVVRGSISNEDIVIRATKEEAVKMLRDREYIVKSFNGGSSTIEPIAGRTTLFAKGYLNMYNELMGKSVTGNIIRLSSD